MPTYRIPANGWRPREYQRGLWRYFERGGCGGKRAFVRAHRRWGKDEVLMHRLCVSAFEKQATYWHMLPEATQARKAIWDAVNPHTGKRRIDEIYPTELRSVTRENEMFIRFINGSSLHLVGSDNYNALVGSPPFGVVFSEWALAHPAAWAYISPILRENGGWAAFISTPRGKNHFWRMEQMARAEGWFVEAASAEQTGAFTADALAAERREMIGTYGADMGAALFEQEYLVSYEAAILGSYYGAELARAEREGRIAAVPVDPALPVHTAWDLGVGDSTAIWFWQATGRSIRIVDYYEAHGEGLKHYAAVIKAKRYRPGTDWVPHDAKVREFVSDARTRIEAMIEAGLRPRLVPDHTLEDGIQAVRATLPRCVFDGERCADGIEALKQYAREWDEKTRSFRDRPTHNWASHCADAARYMCLAWREEAGEQPRPSDRMLTVGYNPDVRQVRLDDLWEAPSRRERERV